MTEYKPSSNDFASPVLTNICHEKKCSDLLKPINENVKYEPSYNHLEDIHRDKDNQPDCNLIQECGKHLEREKNVFQQSCEDSSKQLSEHTKLEVTFIPKAESALLLPREVTDHELTCYKTNQTSEENPLDVETKYLFQYPSQDCVGLPGNDVINADKKECQVQQPCQDSIQQPENNPLSTDKNECLFKNPCHGSLQQSENSGKEDFQSQHPCQNIIQQRSNSRLNTEGNNFQFRLPCQDSIQQSKIKLLNGDKKEQLSDNEQGFQFQLPQPITSVKNSLPQHKSICIRGVSYSVLSVLGKGGSSVVYQVLSPDTNKILAIKKVNLTGLDPLVADGYLNEVELLKSLQGCEHVIKMFASGEEIKNGKKLLYVVMEKGDTDFSTLIRSINKVMQIPFSTILRYWTGMLIAVQEMHKSGVIHSDLKPANFVLAHGKLKLIDFGIASKIHEDMTSVHKEFATGTWNYMSPEALRNTGCSSTSATCYKVTYKSDVWSMGCILYNLLYGCTPFQHIKNTMSKLQAIVDPKVKIDFPKENIPPIFTNALKSCLQRDPKERATVDELLEETRSPFLFWDT